jgi:hypothetical protein
LVFVLFGSATIVMLEKITTEHYTITRKFSRSEASLASQFPAEIAKTQRRTGSKRQNVIVYGGFSPFVGCGFDLEGWSFSLNTAKGKKELGNNHQPQDFDASELYHQIYSRVKKLNIDGMVIEDRLYVDGRTIRNDRLLLPDTFGRPVTWIDDAAMQEFVGKSFRTARHYLCIKVTDWAGDIVVTVFIRFYKKSATLFAECNIFLLTPLKPEFYAIDELDPAMSFRKMTDFFIKSVLTGPFHLIASPFQVYNYFIDPLRKILEVKRISA